MPSSLGLRSSLAFAAVGHVLVALALSAVPSGRAPSVAGDLREVSVALEEPAVDESGDPAPSEASSLVARPAATKGTARPAAVPASSAPGPSVETAAPSSVEPSWSFDALRPGARDLGLGSAGTRLVAAPGAAETVEPTDEARAAARAVDRSIRTELAARDLERGLARSGPLVSAAHEAAGSAGAPETGATVLDVECDAAGTVTSARADDRAWGGVATALVRVMSTKTLRVPHGARGLRARIRIVAELSLPSGNRGTTSVGAVPDDVPGGGRACDGTGATRRCVTGMPPGFTSAGHDETNIGAKPTRVVHVSIVSETEV